MEQFLRVGVISSTHGVRGEVKVYPTTDDPRRFEVLKKVLLDTGKEQKELEITGVKFLKNQVILKFRGYDNINDIEKYKSMDLLVSREDAVPLEENENFIVDLIGMTVVTDLGETLGTLADVLQTGANDVYVVKTPQKKEILLPAIRDCILDVDVEAQRMLVHVLEGLWTDEFSCIDLVSGYDPGWISDKHYRKGSGKGTFVSGDRKYPGFFRE